DERVIIAGAHVGELGAVWRPLRLAVPTPAPDEWKLVAIDGRCRARARDRNAVDLRVPREGNGAAVWRKCRAAPSDDSPGGGAIRARHPDRALGAIRVAAGIGNPASAVRLAATNEGDDRSVVRDRELGQHDAVVVEKLRNAHRFEVRRGGGVDVALATLVREPRDAVRLLRRDELRGKAGAQKPGDCRLVLRGGWRRDEDEDGRREQAAADETRHRVLHECFYIGPAIHYGVPATPPLPPRTPPFRPRSVTSVPRPKYIPVTVLSGEISNLINCGPVGAVRGSIHRNALAFQYSSGACTSARASSRCPSLRDTVSSPYRLSANVPANAVSGTADWALATWPASCAFCTESARLRCVSERVY